MNYILIISPKIGQNFISRGKEAEFHKFRTFSRLYDRRLGTYLLDNRVENANKFNELN